MSSTRQQKKKAQKQLERQETKRTELKAQRMAAENKRIQIKSTATMIEGLFGDYTRLSGAVAQIKEFAKMRYASMTKVAESNPTKYSEMRSEVYKTFFESLDRLDELMKSLAGFLGACDDAGSNREKMLVVANHLGTMYEAQMEFEKKAHELQEIDSRFVAMMDGTAPKPEINIPEVVSADEHFNGTPPEDTSNVMDVPSPPVPPSDVITSDEANTEPQTTVSPVQFT